VIEGRDLQERSKPRELQEHEDEGHSLPGRWVNSHELRAGDCIITRSGTRALITEIRQRFDDAFPVSNLSIIGHHNYAVGDVGVLVHNESICDDAIVSAKKGIREGKRIDEIQDNLNQMVKNGKHTQKEADEALAKILDPNWLPTGVTRTANGGVDFAHSPDLFPVAEGQKNIVRIEYTGTHARDYGAANRAAGFGDTQKAPRNYTWHHLDDYDPITNTGTMQLVRSNTHKATYPHFGGVAQYQRHR
jgi:hypothetical protein